MDCTLRARLVISKADNYYDGMSWGIELCRKVCFIICQAYC